MRRRAREGQARWCGLTDWEVDWLAAMAALFKSTIFIHETLRKVSPASNLRLLLLDKDAWGLNNAINWQVIVVILPFLRYTYYVKRVQNETSPDQVIDNVGASTLRAGGVINAVTHIVFTATAFDEAFPEWTTLNIIFVCALSINMLKFTLHLLHPLGAGHSSRVEQFLWKNLIEAPQEGTSYWVHKLSWGAIDFSAALYRSFGDARRVPKLLNMFADAPLAPETENILTGVAGGGALFYKAAAYDIGGKGSNCLRRAAWLIGLLSLLGTFANASSLAVATHEEMIGGEANLLTLFLPVLYVCVFTLPQLRKNMRYYGAEEQAEAQEPPEDYVPLNP